MGDNNLRVRHRATTSNQCADVLRGVRGLRDAVVFESRHLGRAQHGLIFDDSARYDQGGFGEPITGIGEVWVEATRCKGRSKPFQGVRMEDRKSTRLNSSHLGISYA